MASSSSFICLVKLSSSDIISSSDISCITATAPITLLFEIKGVLLEISTRPLKVSLPESFRPVSNTSFNLLSGTIDITGFPTACPRVI